MASLPYSDLMSQRFIGNSCFGHPRGAEKPAAPPHLLVARSDTDLDLRSMQWPNTSFQRTQTARLFGPQIQELYLFY
jgi:hypothetical protein